MSVASPSLLAPALLAPALPGAEALEAAGRALATAARVVGLVASGLVLAMGLWLLLAGPGFLTDGPAPARVAHRV